MYKLIVFDFDGTIADTDKVIVESYLELYKKFKPASFKPSIRKIKTFSGPPIEKTMAEEFPDKTVEFMISEYRKVSRGNYIKYLKTFKNCREIIEKLKQEGYKIALATSKLTPSTMFSLELLHFEDLFEMIVCGDSVAKQKPAPDCLFKIMDHFGVKNSETLFVGDTMYDYNCAQNANVDVAIMQFKKRDFPEDAKPQKVCKSYINLYNYIKNHGK